MVSEAPCIAGGWAELEPSVLHQAMLDHAGHAIIATDRQGLILYFNRTAQHLLGYRWQDVVGHLTPLQFHVQEEIAAHAAVLSRARGVSMAADFQALVAGLEMQPRIEHDWTYVCADGARLPVRLTITALTNAQGALIGYLGLAADLRERHAHEQELRIAATAFASQAAIMVTDADQRILRVNDAFTRLTGYRAEDAIGQTPRLLKSGRQDASFYVAMWESLAVNGHWEGEIWNRRRSGEIYPEWLTISAIQDAQGRLTHYVSTFTDISELKVAESEIHSLAFYDPLTGLPNRRLMFDRLGQSMAAAARHHQYAALLIIDLDNFKTLNDTLGHDIGDCLLIEVARRLRRSIRESDTAARQGGDEFSVLLDDLGLDAAQAAARAEGVANKLVQELARPYALPGGVEHFCSASIGISLFQGQARSLEAIVKQADIALYGAKDDGRNTYRFFDGAMQTVLDQRARLESGLRQALLAGEFRLMLQAQFDAAGGLLGAECLLRWQKRDGELVSPGEFIPLAEETGLIVPIGHWVIEEACVLLGRWQQHAATQALCLAVNVSARQFRQADFVERIRGALARHQVNPARLKLELTESLLLEQVDDVVGKMRALCELGVRFSLDDFGTGYASLAYLKRFPFEQLKVDRSFIRELAEDPDDAAIVRAILAMGDALRLQVVAEGVENEPQHRFLVEHGCRQFQGYLFGRPLPAAEFEARLAADAASASEASEAEVAVPDPVIGIQFG